MKPPKPAAGGPKPMHKRPVGAGLSLDKFAEAGVSKFDKRRKLERIQKEKLIRYSKLGRLKKKLAKDGALSGFDARDSVAELEALDNPGPSHNAGGEAAERRGSNAKAGPSTGAQPKAPKEGATKAKPLAGDSRAPSHPAGGDEDGPAHKRQKGPHGKPQGRPQPEDREDQEDQGAAPPRLQKQRQEAAGGPGRGAGAGFGKRAGAKQEAQQEEGDDDGQGAGGDGGAERRFGGKRGPRGEHVGGKKVSQLQRLADKVAKQKEEEQRAKEAAMKEREERLKKVAAVEKARKEQKHLHFKRNAKGQPLMRYRLDKILSQLQAPA